MNTSKHVYWLTKNKNTKSPKLIRNQVVALRIDINLYNKLIQYCNRKKLTKSEVIESFIKKSL